MSTEALILNLILLFVLVFIGAIFSGAETALTSFRHTRIRHLADEGNRSAQILQALIERPSRFLATILFSNTLVNTSASVLAGYIAISILPAQLAAIIASIFMTVILLVFSEIGPKSTVVERPESFGLFIARPINWLTNLLYPLVHIFIVIANTFVRPLGGGRKSQGPFMTADEIKTILAVSEEQGVIEEDEKEMLHSIFEFGETLVREVMTPRTDMVCLNVNDSIDDALNIILDQGYSRIPLYEETLDNIPGILYAKDLLKQLRGGNGEAVELIKLARPAYFVPETKKVNELLRELQKRKTHMAIVLDEYGGTAGLVTIEDVLEEIVGEIFDEYDTERVMIEEIRDDVFRVDGRASLDELGELLRITFEGEDWDSVGGLVYGLAGRIPTPGQKVTYKNIDFIVEKLQKHRIIKVKVIKRPLTEEDIEE